MALDPQWGNISQEEADRLGRASVLPVDAAVAGLAVESHTPGSTEPWISRLVGDFVVATGARTVLETGCFQGATSVYLVDALRRLGGGNLWICDVDRSRAEATMHRMEEFADGTPIEIHVQWMDILRFLQISNLPRFDLAFVDDDHTKPHVTKELMLLLPKMNPGGLVLLHDVYGSCDLQEVVRQFGGYSLKLPRLGPAGGLGVIQTP